MFRSVVGMLVGVALVLVFSSVPSETQGKDTNLGTWKINVEKSKYMPGPPPKSGSTRIYRDRGDGMYSIDIEGMNAQGNPTRQMMVFKYDGKEYPLASLNATSITTVANRRIDPQTIEVTFKVNGKSTTTGIERVSPDGKTMTWEVKGSNAQGQTVNNYVVLERQ